MTSHVRKGSKPYTMLGPALTSMPDTFSDVEEDFEIQSPPTNSVSDSPDVPVEFAVKGNPEHYILLALSYIHMLVKIFYKGTNGK